MRTLVSKRKKFVRNTAGQDFQFTHQADLHEVVHDGLRLPPHRPGSVLELNYNGDTRDLAHPIF